MWKLYLMEASPLLKKDNQEKALPVMDRERRERISRMKQEKDKALSMAAGLLLAYSAAEFPGWDNVAAVSGQQIAQSPKGMGLPESPFVLRVNAEQILTALKNSTPVQMEKAPGGKPKLSAPSGFFFNLSHSGDYAVCVVSDGEVGVDIQKWREISVESLSRRVLQEQEKNMVFRCNNEEDRKKVFFSCWAAKEAYVKCTGDGLSKEFRELLADFNVGEVTDTGTGEKKRLHIMDLLLPGYSIAVCENLR
ncbi:MAG: 4'-phosphopantetheinyl transferase family protein [Lachnospiraceae bacterium]